MLGSRSRDSSRSSLRGFACLHNLVQPRSERNAALEDDRSTRFAHLYCDVRHSVPGAKWCLPYETAILFKFARVAELADALASGASARKGVGVQVPPRARGVICGTEEISSRNSKRIRKAPEKSGAFSFSWLFWPAGCRTVTYSRPVMLLEPPPALIPGATNCLVPACKRLFGCEAFHSYLGGPAPTSSSCDGPHC